MISTPMRGWQAKTIGPPLCTADPGYPRWAARWTFACGSDDDETRRRWPPAGGNPGRARRPAGARSHFGRADREHGRSRPWPADRRLGAAECAADLSAGAFGHLQPALGLRRVPARLGPPEALAAARAGASFHRPG